MQYPIINKIKHRARKYELCSYITVRLLTNINIVISRIFMIFSSIIFPKRKDEIKYLKSVPINVSMAISVILFVK